MVKVVAQTGTRGDIEMSEASISEPVTGQWMDLVSPKYAFASLTLCLGVALFAFNGFIVSTAVPTAVIELNGASLISWSVSLYLIFAIVSGSAASLLKQRFGARVTFIAAAGIFLCGTLLAGMASSMPELLFGRALQGVGIGTIEAVCYALIPELFPSQLVSKVFGVEAIVWATAAFGGPLIAGYMMETFSWRAAFLVSVPIVLLFAGLVPIVVPAGTRQSADGGFQGLRLGAIAAGMLLVTTASIAGSPAAAAAMAFMAGLLFMVGVRLDRSAVAKLLPRDAFNLVAPIGLGFWVVLLMPMAQASASVFLVFGIQHLWGYSPTLAGGLNAIMAVSWSLSQIAVASFSNARLRLHMIWLGQVALLMGLGGLVIAFQFSEIAILGVAQVFVGAAFGISWGSLSQTLMEASPLAERNATSALLPTLQSAGYAIGAAVMGLIGNAAGFASFQNPADLQFAMIVVFVSSAALAVPALIAAIRVVKLVSRAR